MKTTITTTIASLLLLASGFLTQAQAALTADQQILAAEVKTINPSLSLTAAPFASFDQLAQATAKAIQEGKLPADRAVTAAYTLPNSGVDYRDADPLVLLAVTRQVAGDYVQIKNATRAAYTAALLNLTPQTSDDAAVAAALSSAATRGILNSNVSMATKALGVQTVVKAAVTASLALQGATIKNYDPVTGTVTNGAATGAAGVVTGAVSLSQKVGSTANNSIVAAIVSGAVSVDSKQYIQIAQAAAQAAAFVFGYDSRSTAKFVGQFIVDAVKQGLVSAAKGRGETLTAGQLAQQLNYVKLTVAYGIQAASRALAGDASAFGAGAKGVSNYTFNNLYGAPITDVTGL